jgi:predicted esterase
MTRPRPIRTSTEHTIEVPRSARYYTLGDPPPGGELWVVLHGIGQLAGDFVEYFSVLNDGTRVIAAPEALNRAYLAPVNVPAAERPVGAVWMTREFREQEMRDYVRYLDLLHAELTERHRPARTIVVGFSQGGATASRWAVRGSSPIDHLVLWGATLPPDVDPATVNEKLRGASLSLVIGRTDQYISPESVAAERARLDGAHVKYRLTEFDAGHSIKRAVLLHLAQELAAPFIGP